MAEAETIWENHLIPEDACEKIFLDGIILTMRKLSSIPTSNQEKTYKSINHVSG